MNATVCLDDDNGLDCCAPVEPVGHSMRQHSPDLDQFLRNCDITDVWAEYSGSDGRGSFLALRFPRADGTECDVWDKSLNLVAKTLFQLLLLARHPDWSRSSGSSGDFHWSLQSNSLIHSHYSRGERNERATCYGLSSDAIPS